MLEFHIQRYRVAMECWVDWAGVELRTFFFELTLIQRWKQDFWGLVWTFKVVNDLIRILIIWISSLHYLGIPSKLKLYSKCYFGCLFLGIAQKSHQKFHFFSFDGLLYLLIFSFYKSHFHVKNALNYKAFDPYPKIHFPYLTLDLYFKGLIWEESQCSPTKQNLNKYWFLIYDTGYL